MEIRHGGLHGGWSRAVFGIALILVGAQQPFCTSVAAHPLSTVYSFCTKGGCRDGANGEGLSADPSGNLYGVTAGPGGKSPGGTVYELTGGKRFRLLYRFCLHKDCSDGDSPLGSPIIDVNGNVYGTTIEGGANGRGVVFEIAADGTYHKLYDFCSQGGNSCTDGAIPFGGLAYAGAQTGALYDGVSPLYGVTEAGGSQGYTGVVYMLTRDGDSWSETVLYAFCPRGGHCTDGSYPNGMLWPDAGGNLFGVTSEGGANRTSDFPAGGGTVFELTPNGNAWTESVLYSFCAQSRCADGAFPDGSLFQDASGTLYGGTGGGGYRCTRAGLQQTCGVVFSLASSGGGWLETVLHAFCEKTDCPDGAFARGPLVIDPAGDLLGATLAGGGNDSDVMGIGGGVLFELSGTTYKILHRFCSLGNCADGEYPEAGVILSNGTLYGATFFGGIKNAGSVFKLKP
ncbi:MAG TPA: choice-of-anchor tandem repeat GloVer-containing protein [Rhizomicrobium sp.]|nr:choice-of-anchor tandem repeat GloVer-containing protein [Rhizomicrobium sp.]